MKKVVLLAGAIAAGMAVVPQAANAAAPETNDVQEINLTNDQIQVVKEAAQAELDQLTLIAAHGKYAAEVASVDQTTINNAIYDLTWTISQMTSLQNGTLGLLNGNFYTTNAIYPLGTLQRNPSSASAPATIARYNGKITRYSSTINDLAEEIINSVQTAKENARTALSAFSYSLTPAEIASYNKLTHSALVNSDEYKHLEDLYAEGADISPKDGSVKDEYNHDIYKDLLDSEFNAHFNNAIQTANNLIQRVANVETYDKELVNRFQMQALIDVTYPELEGMLVDFKTKANEAAAEAIKGYMDERNIDGTDGVIEKIQHHLDSNAKCFNKEAHKIADAQVVKDAKKVLEDKYGYGLEDGKYGEANPDEVWKALDHTFANPDQALVDPKAVALWDAIQKETAVAEEAKTNEVDKYLNAYQTAIYQTCLKWDKDDITSAIAELSGDAYVNGLQSKTVTVLAADAAGDADTPVAVDSQLKAWLDRFLNDQPDNNSYKTGTYIPGSIADEYWDLFHDGTLADGTITDLVETGKTNVSRDEFATGEAAIDKLANTIYNVKTNWEDIKDLDAQLVDLRLDIETAKVKKGYSSTTITNKWSATTNSEIAEHNALVTAIENAINAINDKDATAASNSVAGEWVGKGSFATTIALENDHHDWLDAYQKANWDAYQTMLAAINQRRTEATNVESSTLSSTKDSALEDMSKETVSKNSGVTFYNIQGENPSTGNNNGIYIYRVKYFNEIENHFSRGGNPGGSAAQGHGDDLRNDRITSWYNNADAEYIGSKNYAAGWADAEHLGELKNNTGKGVADVLTTEATEADNVVFGWLQKEIQKAYQEIVINEAANRKLHDQIDDCATYVQNAKNDIDNYAKFTLSHLKQDVEVYDMAARAYSTETRGDESWNLDILYPGTTSGVPALAPVALPDEYKTKEDATVITLSPVSPNYNSNFACGHDTAVKGWTWIGIEINDLRNLERTKYNAVESKALLDTKEVENRITIVEENVDDIKNEAYTQIIKNGFARVHNSINEARAWAAALDGVCHEDGLKPCSTEDVKNNPCGWDDPAASKALADLINYYNEKLTLLGTEHNAENNDDHSVPVIAEDNIKEFAGYLDQMYKDLNAWAVKFAAADAKHKKALNAALDLAGEEAHALHHYSYDANQALINYNDAEKAAANLWAVDFSKRKIGTFDGEEVTFQQFVKKIDDKMIAEGAVDHTLDPDVYAAIKKFAAEPIANFQDYIDATEKLEGFIKAVAQVYYNHHQYTELKKLADGTKNFNWDADFQKAVDANNAAHVELLKQLAQAQATLDAAKNDVIADKNEVYPVDYTTLTTTNLEEAQDVLDAQKTNIEKAWKDGKAADYSANGNEDGVLEVKGYALDITKDGKNVIDAYVEKAQAAKNLYAANKVAKEELLVQIQAILTNTNSAYEEVECAETAGCTQNFRTDLDNLKKALVGENGNGGIKKEVNDGFAAKFADKTAAQLKDEVDALETKLGQVKKDVAEFNHKVLASADAKADILDKIEKAFGTEGSLMKPALAETGAENFKHVPATGEVRNTAKYFDEINAEIDDLKTTITNDDSHAGNHSALEKYNTYLQTLAGIKADLEELVQAIKDNEQAHKDQLKHRDELYKKYECYDTTGLEAAVNGIADPDFSLDTEFPEVPGYPETAVDPDDKDHTKAHTAVAEAIKALDAEIKKHYENGASNMDDAKTLIGEKETEYTTAFKHAQTNDSKFMEEYGKWTEAAKAVKYTYENWKADHFENGANKYSDEANVQVTNAYSEMVAAQKAYLADIKTDWYKNEAVEKVANNATLLNTYKEKISAYNAAVEKAQTNDQEFDKQLAAHVVKPLTAEATYTDTRVVADPVYVDLKAQLTALYPECNNVEATSKYNTIRKQIIQDWEDEKSALNGTAEAVAAYQAAANKYNELMANLNAYGSQLVKYLQQKDAFDAAKTTIAGYDIMKPGYKDFDGNTEGAEDYNHKKDIENAISNINGKLDTLYGDMKTEANHVAETINDADLTNNEVNDLNVAPAVGTLKTLIENLVKDAKNYEDACDANEAAFEPLHDNIKTVEADYAEGSAKVTALPEPAQEAFNLAVKNDLEALAELQKDLEKAYMDEKAVNFTKDNTDYEDLKKEIEEMYKRAEEAGAHLGDIDFNGDVTVYDSDALVDIVLYNRGYAVRGDFDFNGENDVTDVERLNNLLWYEHIEKAWAPGRVAFEGDIELTAEGNTVALALNNNVQTNGIQFDITVPEGAYIQNVLGTDRVEGMRVLTACIADNTYRVLVISTLNASTINDNEGAIVTFNVCGGNEVEVSNVIATDGNSHRLNGAAVSVGTVTGIDEIASEGQTDIFGLDGIRQGTMKDGVNIVRGANGIVKKIFKK